MGTQDRIARGCLSVHHCVKTDKDSARAGERDVKAVARDKQSGSLRRSAVKKHVAAIHISGKLSLLQRKLSTVLLQNAYDTLTTASRHEIDVAVLSAMIGYNSNDVDTLKQSLRGLVETVVEWDMLNPDQSQEWGVSSLLAYAKLKSGVCEYAYSQALAEKLHDPDVFAMINLDIMRKFSSGHALALYENCYRFVRTGSTGWWSIETFRRLMGVDDSAYYESFKHLNAKIIKPAVEEVNRASNIILTPEFKRMGRQVRDVRFLIGPNPQLALLDIDDGGGLRKTGVYERLRGMGVSDRLARQWLAQQGEDYVREKLEYVAGQGGVKDPVRYLSAALKSDYRPETTAPKPKPDPTILAARHAEAVEQDARDAEITAERRSRAATMERVRSLAAARTPTQRDADRRQFMATLTDETDRETFARLGWSAALLVTQMAAFWDRIAAEE